MNNCIFCKIVREEIPRETILETENLIVFKNTHPKASIHFLMVPKEHLLDISETNDNIWTEIKNIALKLAKEYNVSGMRLVNNMGAAQEVKHMHVHFLGEVGIEREL